jgi:hypothetical protein
MSCPVAILSRLHGCNFPTEFGQKQAMPGPRSPIESHADQIDAEYQPGFSGQLELGRQLELGKGEGSTCDVLDELERRFRAVGVLRRSTS